ncbi:MAG: DUF4910 domain-containing protein [Ardenticatenaceae bacterium]|nr:DUF4910 domain-containing protein [Ardenticatenaceae bacterium]
MGLNNGISELIRDFGSEKIGLEMHQLMTELFPLCRSITGDGVRQSLQIISQHLPLKIQEVPTGTQVFDWEIPYEWNIRDAYVKNSSGEKVIDFQESNLHVVNYSIPVHKTITLAELKDHLFSLPEHPDWIPYQKSYFSNTWGFCLQHRKLQALKDEKYEVFIDASLEPGNLTYGEYYLEGEMEDEILISCHCCHPSLCNDNLSGMVLTAFLGKYLSSIPLRYSYRLLFIPSTIGSVTWMALNKTQLSKIRHGLVAACVGDPGHPTYKKSRNGRAEIDRAVEHILKHSGEPFSVDDFSPFGYDERQFSSPGINLPIGSLTRTSYGRFPEYHTSADNLEFVRPLYLADSLKKYLAVFDVLENNKYFFNCQPYGEPRLGKRGLTGAFGGGKDAQSIEKALLWVLNFSDGENNLLDIAERAELPFSTVKEAASALIKVGLLREQQSKSILHI